MTGRGGYRSALAGWLTIAVCVSGPAWALTIQFDYSHDATGFFDPQTLDGAQARATLQNAAANLEMFTDNLSAIVPSGGNTWSAGFTDPATGNWVYTPGLVVPADTLIIYAGARQLGSNTLGEGGPGGYSISGPQGSYQQWSDLVTSRGQPGALASPATDFGPWGGSIAFDSTTKWNFDLATGPSDNTQNDFFSTCLHELCHVLGFGSSNSWSAQIDATSHFTGSAAEAAYGGPVPLAGDSHWGIGVEGLTGGQVQEAEMDPSLTVGTRKRLTNLDVAGLRDIGWQLPLVGDANGDGVVDASDYVLVKENIGRVVSATWADGDFDFDGKVTWLDLAALEQNFGATLASPAATAPEPMTLMLLAAGALGLIGRRRRPRR